MQNTGLDLISGFLRLEIKEIVDGTTSILYDRIIPNDINFRFTDEFTSRYSRNTYYFMMDYGVREKIVGI